MTGDILRVLIALGAILLAGHGGVCWLGKGAAISWPERLGLSWLLGAGFVSVALPLLGFFARGAVLIGAVAACAFALFVMSRKSRFAPAQRDALSPLEWLLVAALFGQAVFLAWWTPQTVLGWDGLIIWESKARFAFLNGGVLPVSYFQDASRMWTQPHYPLLLPGVETWLYLWLGRADEAWARLPGVLFYLAAVGILSGACGRLGGSRTAGLAVAVAMFFVPYHFAGTWGVLSGYADFPLGVLWLAAVSWLLALPDDAAAVRFAAVLGALLVWMKREGVFPWITLVLVAAVLLWRAKRLRAVLWIAAPGLALSIGCAMFLSIVKAPADPNYLPLTFENLVTRADRIGLIAAYMGGEILNFESWSLLWIGAFPAIAIQFLRQRRHAFVLAAALAGPLPGFALAFMLSNFGALPAHLDLALPRLLLQLAPTALLAIALAIPQISLVNSSSTSESRTPDP